MSLQIGVFLAQPALIWAAVGVVLLIVEVLLSGGFFISFAAAAFLVALANWLGFAPEALVWNVAITLAIGLLLVPVFRAALRRFADRTPDINRY